MSIADTHATYDDRWWTPEPWWQWVESTHGVPRSEIWDPCPAKRSKADGRNARPPKGKPAYINPPGEQTEEFWLVALRALRLGCPVIWCAFNVEFFRRIPEPLLWPGWLVLPLQRTPFVWGGESRKGREHGEPATSPSHWSAWWSSVDPATPPVPSVITRTGPDVARLVMP